MTFMTRLCVAVFLSLSLLLAGRGQTQPSQTQIPQSKATAYLEEQWRLSRAPAVSVAVAYQGRIVFSKGIGLADLDNNVPATSSTVYNIGSGHFTRPETLANLALTRNFPGGGRCRTDPPNL